MSDASIQQHSVIPPGASERLWHEGTLSAACEYFRVEKRVLFSVLVRARARSEGVF